MYKYIYMYMYMKKYFSQKKKEIFFCWYNLFIYMYKTGLVHVSTGLISNIHDIHLYINDTCVHVYVNNA